MKTLKSSIIFYNFNINTIYLYYNNTLYVYNYVTNGTNLSELTNITQQNLVLLRIQFEWSIGIPIIDTYVWYLTKEKQLIDKNVY